MTHPVSNFSACDCHKRDWRSRSEKWWIFVWRNSPA